MKPIPIQWTKETVSELLVPCADYEGWEHTASVLEGVKSIASDLDRLLEEDWRQGVHRDIKPKADQCEHTHN